MASDRPDSTSSGHPERQSRDELHPGLRHDGVIARVIEFSAHNKFLILLLVAAAMVGAIWSVKRVPLDAIPDLSDTQVI
ncbi:MAG: hypothetical protein HY599_01420, partial [Candidatus Omnitrophica bacterium]|nr:hypothetical protein [Candidatus Omnitrophota bacterium]